MGLKARVQNQVTKRLFSLKRRDKIRHKLERQRHAAKAPHVVEYFHEASDPYSHLMAQVLPEFCQRYDIQLKVHLVAPPPDWAAPERQRLQAYARLDAARLAARAGLAFTDPGAQPSAEHLNAANMAFATAIKTDTFLADAARIGERFWSGQEPSAGVALDAGVEQMMATHTERRDKMGHYLGATLHYGGEWYWGVDRLHYLEARLRDLGAASSDTDAPIFAPPIVPEGPAIAPSSQKPELHWYLSFRSPYTGIVADRIKALADAYGAELKLRYVLPMVMRGMEIRRTKGFYIMHDVVREADRLGVSFGNVFDPVGKPVERGYALLHRAIELGRGFEFARSFLSGVWADGLDAGSDAGLRTITERAGLSWQELKPLLGGDHWRADEHTNQEEMLSYDIWGVPSFRVGNVAAWGQDRLWVVEQALKAQVAQESELGGV
nr:DsbA family protein [Hyphomonas sp. Mor2]